MGAQDELKKARQRKAAADLIARRSGRAIRPITGGVDLQKESLAEVLAQHRARMSGLTPHKAQAKVSAEVARLKDAGAIPDSGPGKVPEPVTKTLRKGKVAKATKRG